MLDDMMQKKNSNSSKLVWKIICFYCKYFLGVLILLNLKTVKKCWTEFAVKSLKMSLGLLTTGPVVSHGWRVNAVDILFASQISNSTQQDP